jgi:hypothetical protein
MSGTAVIRYQVKPEAADENERLVAEVFAQLAEERPEGMRYVSFRLADGVSFVHIFETDGDADPLGSLPAFKEFQKGFKDRVAAGPTRDQATMIGSYRFIED